VNEDGELERCVASGGVAVFPTDTVYGLCCDPESERSVRRPARKPAAVMYFTLGAALDALPEIGPRTRGALQRLLPGPVTLLLPNPLGRFPLAGGDALGLRVPVSPFAIKRPVLQTSANDADGSDPRTVDDIPAAIRRAVDLVIDAGELPGVPSTIVDLRDYERNGQAPVVPRGATSN